MGKSLVEEPVFKEGANHARRALGLEGDGAVALILESVHFLLNYIRRVADAAHEKLGVFNYRRAQFVNAVQAAQIAHFFSIYCHL